MDQSQAPLPAYNAYRFAAGALRNAVFLRDVVDFSGVKGYEFQKDTQRIWILWSLDGATHSSTLPEPPQAVYDVFGNAQAPAAEVTVSLSPVYVTWQ